MIPSIGIDGAYNAGSAVILTEPKEASLALWWSRKKGKPFEVLGAMVGRDGFVKPLKFECATHVSLGKHVAEVITMGMSRLGSAARVSYEAPFMGTNPSTAFKGHYGTLAVTFPVCAAVRDLEPKSAIAITWRRVVMGASNKLTRAEAKAASIEYAFSEIENMNEFEEVIRGMTRKRKRIDDLADGAGMARWRVLVDGDDV